MARREEGFEIKEPILFELKDHADTKHVLGGLFHISLHALVGAHPDASATSP